MVWKKLKGVRMVVLHQMKSWENDDVIQSLNNDVILTGAKAEFFVRNIAFLSLKILLNVKKFKVDANFHHYICLHFRIMAI